MRTLVAVAVVCLVAIPAFAESQPEIRPSHDQLLSDFAQAMENENIQTREKLTQALIQFAAESDGDTLAKSLDAIAAKTKDADVLNRINRVRGFIGGGEVVDGLRVRLDVDKQAVRPGETINITTTLMNLTDKPMQVEVGYTTTGNYFESGSALAASFTTGTTGQTAPAQPKWCVGFCGTGATNIIHTLEPMSAVAFTTPATYGPIDSQFAPVAEGQPRPVGLALGKGKYSYIPLDANGTLSLTVQRENGDIRPKPRPKAPQPLDPNQPQLQLINPGFPQPKIDADKPFWHGTMKSNTVELKVFTQQVG